MNKRIGPNFNKKEQVAYQLGLRNARSEIEQERAAQVPLMTPREIAMGGANSGGGSIATSVQTGTLTRAYIRLVDAVSRIQNYNAGFRVLAAKMDENSTPASPPTAQRDLKSSGAFAPDMHVMLDSLCVELDEYSRHIQRAHTLFD